MAWGFCLAGFRQIALTPRGPEHYPLWDPVHALQNMINTLVFRQALEDVGQQFIAMTDFKMNNPPQYVADSPLGGRRDLGDLIGREAAEADHVSSEDYWPRIPLSYRPPPAHLETAVKEGAYTPSSLLMKTR